MKVYLEAYKALHSGLVHNTLYSMMCLLACVVCFVSSNFTHLCYNTINVLYKCKKKVNIQRQLARSYLSHICSEYRTHTYSYWYTFDCVYVGLGMIGSYLFIKRGGVQVEI